MSYTECLIKIPVANKIKLPENSTALLTAIDAALDGDTYTVCTHDDIDSPEYTDDDLTTYLLFETDNTDRAHIATKIREIVSYACSPEVIETTDKYQIVAIDYCVYSFK